MIMKLQFENFPQMTTLYDTQCDYTIEEVKEIAIKKMYTGMTARITNCDGTELAVITK